MTGEQVPAAEVARRAGLPRLGGRPPLVDYSRDLWERRALLVELARSRFRATNEGTRLGMAWVVIRPLLNAAVYGLVFGLLLPAGTRPDNFVPFLVVGIFVFQFFSGCLNDGAKAITGNLGLVRTLRFPRALLPLASVLQQLLALGPMMVVAAVICVVFGEPVGLRWLGLLPALLLLATFSAGVAMIAARATLHIRDITQLLPFVTRLLFYTSGIFYAVDRVGLPRAVEVVALLNPVHVYIALSRGALVEGQAVDGSTWWLGVGWALVVLVLGYLFFWRAEERYGRE
ncbi:ABC transporter permease [uncultured Pseudokineococcus sp.]|uniref:ABC transporter permease n=1 Tax=uncultured Pseudokineococcus sp. TaxID=1642928 RepID=UPI002635FE4D|nr:ABC transporter permease [uncultured Pseudokineococcus sp.]